MLKLVKRILSWYKIKRYERASRTEPGLRGMLMYEWSRSTGELLPEEERQRIREAQSRPRLNDRD